MTRVLIDLKYNFTGFSRLGLGKMEQLETMEYYILQTQDILNVVYKDKEQTDKLAQVYVDGNYKNIKIVASGSSGNGALCAKYIMEKYLGVDVTIISPYTFAYYPRLSEDDFVFVISQSGYSKNALDALDVLKKINRKTIALTGDLNSDIKNHADVVIGYVDEEKEGFVTKGVTTLALFLMKLTFAILKKQGKEVDTAWFDDYCESFASIQKENFVREEAFLEKFRKNLLSMEHMYAAGCGPAEGVAKEAALKIGETVKIVSCGYELEEYIHGPNLQLSPKHNVFIIDAQDETSDRSYQIFRASRTVSDRVYYITDKEYEDDHVLTLLNPCADTVALTYLQVFQLFAYRISKELGTIKKHPLYEEFKKIVNSKTITYED